MPAFFPKNTVEWNVEEPAAFRRITISLIEVALLTGVVVRLARSLLLAHQSTSPIYLGFSFVILAVLLFGLMTAHVGNFPLRQWLWRVPAFAFLEAVGEAVVSLLLILVGREPNGSSMAVMGDWPAMVATIVSRRLLYLAVFGGLLAMVVSFVRYALLRRDDQAALDEEDLHDVTADSPIEGSTRLMMVALSSLVAFAPLGAQGTSGTSGTPVRPFGTLREQAVRQQAWLEMRMKTILPALMRKHGVEMWIVPMREYNEDPVFSSIVSPTTFAARRRTIYVFRDLCGQAGCLSDPCVGKPGCVNGVERIALGGTSQGGVFHAVRSTKTVASPVPGARGAPTAELWGDQQWQVLKELIEARNPQAIAINSSKVWAFADGLTAGESEGMREALGSKWVSRLTTAEGLAVELIATRLPDEAAFYKELNALTWAIIDTAFSNRVITPGVTRTSDVVWWMRQRVNDMGLGTWFQPSVEVQRRGVTDQELGDDPIIQKGDVLHCDFGITALRLNTDTQHMGYVLRDGEMTPPAGLRTALRQGNLLQDIVMQEVRPGRTGNEILASSREKMRAADIDGTIYSHPIGMNGHGAGPLIGLWDYQEGVPGRGDARVIPDMWYSIELQATTPVPEWSGQGVRMALEEDMIIGPDGRPRWALRRQTELHLVRPRPAA